MEAAAGNDSNAGLHFTNQDVEREMQAQLVDIPGAFLLLK
jgi:hypothetical protein